jgi:hypothetical protein
MGVDAKASAVLITMVVGFFAGRPSWLHRPRTPRQACKYSRRESPFSPSKSRLQQHCVALYKNARLFATHFSRQSFQSFDWLPCDLAHASASSPNIGFVDSQPCATSRFPHQMTASHRQLLAHEDHFIPPVSNGSGLVLARSSCGTNTARHLRIAFRREAAHDRGPGPI